MTYTDTKNYYSLEEKQSAEKFSLKYRRDLNTITIKGKSTSLELEPVYIQLIDQVKAHFETSNVLYCYFNYSAINTSTVKFLFNFFSLLRSADENGNSVVVYWIIEENDKDLVDIGLDLKNHKGCDIRITHR